MGVGVRAAGASVQLYVITVVSNSSPSQPEISTSCFLRPPADAFSQKTKHVVSLAIDLLRAFVRSSLWPFASPNDILALKCFRSVFGSHTGNTAI